PQRHVLDRDESVEFLGEALGLEDDVVSHVGTARPRADRSGPRASRATRGLPRPSPTTACTRPAPAAPPRGSPPGRGRTTRGAARGVWGGGGGWGAGKAPAGGSTRGSGRALPARTPS